MNVEPLRRYVELVTERTVERFLRRLFLREPALRSMCIVSPFISSLADSRYSLSALRAKIEREEVPTYVITRRPNETYQAEAMAVLEGCRWIELRYNASVHAKLYVVHAKDEHESFVLFGSGNLTSRAIENNIELAMMVYARGPGRDLVHELHYWANVRLRTIEESCLIQPIRAKGRR